MKPAMTAAEFRRIRVALGHSQAELAERIGVHRVTISNFEAGRYPIFKTVAELMRCLYRTGRRAR